MPTSNAWPPPEFDPADCTIADIRRQIKQRGYLTTGRGRRTKVELMKELMGLVRAEQYAPPTPSYSAQDSIDITTEGKALVVQRWNPGAGLVDQASLQKGPGGKPLCRFCKQEVTGARRTFCSAGCVHEHKIRTQGTYVRKCLLIRDGGQCAQCGLDAAGLYRKARQAWITAGQDARNRAHAVAQAMEGTPFEDKVPRPRIKKRPTQGMFWHADHILPVVQGGGQCGLSNYRTLCVPCHAEVTKHQARERVIARETHPLPLHSRSPRAKTSMLALSRDGENRIEHENGQSSNSSSGNDDGARSSGMAGKRVDGGSGSFDGRCE